MRERIKKDTKNLDLSNSVTGVVGLGNQEFSLGCDIFVISIRQLSGDVE